MEPNCDVLVVGGGIAGVSIGCELAPDHRVVVLDMEPTLAFHTTGRSAAMFLESYGGPVIRALTIASRAFLDAVGVLSPLPMLHIARRGRGSAIRALHASVAPLVPDVVLLEPADAAELQPLLRPDRIELALLEPGAMAIDVHALHQLYLHRLRERGGQVATTARVTSAEREGERWQVSDAAGRTWSADVVVNAAGAWADQIAALFGAGGAGLAPMRRTAFMVDAPPDARAPMVADIDDAFYFRPDAGRLLCSPADETPSEPIDARPDELEIARAIEVINDVTRLDVRHVRSAWAGLRTFVPDRAPLVGYDDAVDGLFWYAAQGGYGIQMAAALARTGAALLRGAGVPDDVAARGLAATDIAPRRNAGAAAGG